MKTLLTMTTCNRLPLFFFTLGTVKWATLDFAELAELVVIDDFSEPAQVENMLAGIPMLVDDALPSRIVQPDVEDPGNRRSRQLTKWLEMLEGYDYVFHVEDDWQFLRAEHYLRESIEVLEQQPSIAEVCFCGGSAADADVSRFACNGRDYYCWNYDGSLEWQRRMTSQPHYTTRPAVLRVSSLKSLGVFDLHFKNRAEWNFALKYAAAGFKTAYTAYDAVRHLGYRYRAGHPVRHTP